MWTSLYLTLQVVATVCSLTPLRPAAGRLYNSYWLLESKLAVY